LTTENDAAISHGGHVQSGCGEASYRRGGVHTFPVRSPSFCWIVDGCTVWVKEHIPTKEPDALTVFREAVKGECSMYGPWQIAGEGSISAPILLAFVHKECRVSI
jgi:hypothetical protein